MGVGKGAGQQELEGKGRLFVVSRAGRRSFREHFTTTVWLGERGAGGLSEGPASQVPHQALTPACGGRPVCLSVHVCTHKCTRDL